jgi:hypothetical protein
MVYGFLKQVIIIKLIKTFPDILQLCSKMPVQSSKYLNRELTHFFGHFITFLGDATVSKWKILSKIKRKFLLHENVEKAI